MITVEFPSQNFRLKKEGDNRYVFDELRKTWLLLTDEEWVRQHFVAYLLRTMKYPASFIALEKGLSLNGLKKRFDVLVYDDHHQPWMMIECKAPYVKLSDDVLQQVLRYNIALPVRYMVITNGDTTMAWEKSENRLEALQALPQWKE